MSNEQPVIIIRKKKGGHGGHHGGAWKVAYADFMTAMMAFFLLMWLLSMTTPAERKAIADYFAPMGISQSMGGAGGAMGGRDISSDASRGGVSSSSSPGLTQSFVTTAGKGEEGDEDVSGKSKSGASGEGAGEELTNIDRASRDAMALARSMKSEEQKFKEAETALVRAISEAPELQGLSQHLVIDRTAEGLRIQIIDRDKFSLFPSGSSIPYKKGRDLLRLVGRVISLLPNRISVTGHTDSSPFPRGSRRDNWDLSTDRANVSRSELQAGGVPIENIARVVGMADRDPYIADNPKDPRNRRISIVLLRHGLSVTEPKAEKREPVPTPIKTRAVNTPNT